MIHPNNKIRNRNLNPLKVVTFLYVYVTSLWKWFGVGILMNLKLKYVYRVIKSHCTITRLAKCILKNQKYLLFFYNTWNTVSWIAFLQLPTHNLIFCLAHLLIFKQNMQNWLQTIDKKKSLLIPKIWQNQKSGIPDPSLIMAVQKLF